MMIFNDLFYRIRNVVTVFLLLGFVMTNGYAAPDTKPIACTQQYGLCTSAPCIPDPNNKEYAICSCVVKTGLSIGYKTCKERAIKHEQYNITRLTSTFSFAQFDTKKALTCAKGNPWTNCLDSPCVLDPVDNSKAICSCKIYNQEEFITFGGDCNTKTCATGFWSATTLSTAEKLPKFLAEKLHLTKDPWSNSVCPKINKTSN